MAPTFHTNEQSNISTMTIPVKIVLHLPWISKFHYRFPYSLFLWILIITASYYSNKLVSNISYFLYDIAPSCIVFQNYTFDRATLSDLSQQHYFVILMTLRFQLSQRWLCRLQCWLWHAFHCSAFVQLCVVAQYVMHVSYCASMRLLAKFTPKKWSLRTQKN